MVLEMIQPLRCSDNGSQEGESTDMKSITMREPGGPEVLNLVEGPEPVTAPGEALVEVFAAGVNFMDTIVRRGNAWSDMVNPKALGVEGAGR